MPSHAGDIAASDPRWRRRGRWALLVAAVAAVLILPYVILEPWLDDWGRAMVAAGQAHPVMAALLVIGLLAADVLLPVPSSAVNALAGLLFGWAVGAALIWLGLSLGCVLGYALGARAARSLASRLVGDRDLARAVARFGPAAPAALVLTRAVPVLAEAGTLAAGAAGMKLRQYLWVTGLANAGVALVYAGVGAAALDVDSFFLAFLAATCLPVLAWGAWQLRLRVTA